ncbi:biopolymer transporter ExbD [Pontixanthobacter sp. CEM42]|uniref:ExbD/TolR family protein n=1 Tax=Pontixanthobacter sp. CEM42 TaxID=2792077 RepID=UPI001ADF5232|nr:biopolymer transporter ExbD [Pontixanthobacter sp. CEM42]
MGQATAPAAGQPMGDLNTTPLIDVMLVLLVMFIITIPVATHSIEVDLPVPCGTECPDIPKPDAVKNKIVLNDQNQILWNGTAVTEQQMAALLIQTTQMDVEPELQFEPTANASYALAAQTLNTIKSVGVSKFGFVGNERYRRFTAASEET